MELYAEMLSKILENERIIVSFPDLELTAAELVERTAYAALKKIKAVIENDSLDDRECFMKIEKIVEEFEHLGSDGGARHDF